MEKGILPLICSVMLDTTEVFLEVGVTHMDDSGDLYVGGTCVERHAITLNIMECLDKPGKKKVLKFVERKRENEEF